MCTWTYYYYYHYYRIPVPETTTTVDSQAELLPKDADTEVITYK